MSRKSLIVCLSAVYVMLLVIGLAIFLLYSDGKKNVAEVKAEVLSQSLFRPLEVVPSDAALVSCFGKAERASVGMLSGLDELNAIIGGIKEEGLNEVLARSFTVSLHYSGKLQALYVFDQSGVAPETQTALNDFLSGKGLYVESAQNLLLASRSRSLVKSGVRHQEQKLCVLDAPGFLGAVGAVGNGDALFISNAQARNLLKTTFADRMFGYAGFFESLSEWTVANISASEASPLSLRGKMLCEKSQGKFMTVFEKCHASVAKVAEILPSYTTSAFSIPLSDVKTYMSAYAEFVDSRQRLQSYRFKQDALTESVGISPEEFFEKLDVKEVATATFNIGGNNESVNLIRVGKEDLGLIFKDQDVSSFDLYMPSMYDWAYASFTASVFGELFSLKEETHCTYIGGWLITGSPRAVDEYVTNGAWKYTLDEYMEHAGKSDLLGANPSLFVGYTSFTEKGVKLSDYVKSGLRDALKKVVDDSEYCPAVLSVGKSGGSVSVSFDVYDLTLSRTKAPTYDKDTSIDVSSGPFTVKNSGTGKNNTFYQNSSMAICLKNEKGKDLWGVPLGKPICGTAHNVDYFANGKLQIIFGAGSQIYIIDRLGRYVSGFPLDLKQEIVLGPDVYDFSGARKYNIMVLHKDNTIQMYNLKGEKPEAWKGITAGETIKALPERLTIKGSDFWVVRTSRQTLIFPFYGGEPISDFSGDRMIRPDSKVVIDGNSVKVDCYDGKTRTVRLK